MKNKLTSNSNFSYYVGLSALLIALCAAIFSVYGIGNLFSGAAISTMVMAGCLEIGKLISTTFLYRYWDRSTRLIKWYLILAVFILMVITSAGIFGFLSSAYQSSSLNFKLNQDKIVATELSKGFYTNQINSSEERIRVLNETRKIQENRLSESLTNQFLSRNPIQLQQIQQQTIKMVDQANDDIKNENTKIEGFRTKIQSIDQTVTEMKVASNEKKDIQTFKFLADSLGTSLDTVVKWFIICLIIVFDPLAIALILAYNITLYNKEDSIVESKTDKEIPNTIKTDVESDNKIENKSEENVNNTVLPSSEKDDIVSSNEPQKNFPVDDFFRGMFKQ